MYLWASEFQIFADYQQSKHEDSSQPEKDPYRWKGNILKIMISKLIKWNIIL